MADDVSWECFGCYGAEDYKTPRLDRLAKNGVKFKHCYSTPICTTSRVNLMTARSDTEGDKDTVDRPTYADWPSLFGNENLGMKIWEFRAKF